MILGVVTGLAAEARLARPLGPVLAGGGVPAGAAQAAETLVAQGATHLLSFGLAGGLDPALRPGALVIPAAVVEEQRFAVDAALLNWLGGASHALLAAASGVVATRAAKAALFAATGAVAVDLESGAVARVATASRVPFAVLRAVCDPAQSDLPPAALLALDRAGMIGLGRVLGSLSRRPGQVPALLRLARDAARARTALVGRVRLLGRGGGAGLVR